MKGFQAIIFVAIMTAAMAFAQAPPTGNAPAGGGPGGDAPAASSVQFDFTPFIQEVDTDQSGTISLAEWNASGVCESIFTMLHTTEGDMTIAELTARSPQAEADQNGDGKLNVEEMIWVCNAGPSGDAPAGGGAPSGGGAPGGGAPGGGMPPGGGAPQQ